MGISSRPDNSLVYPPVPELQSNETSYVYTFEDEVQYCQILTVNVTAVSALGSSVPGSVSRGFPIGEIFITVLLRHWIILLSFVLNLAPQQLESEDVVIAVRFEIPLAN